MVRLKGRHWVLLWLLIFLGGALLVVARQTVAFRTARQLHDLREERSNLEARRAELERRMRVNDRILRYMTIRVDLDRRRAQKFKDRRARKAAKRPLKGKAKEAAADIAAEIAE